jgi:multiple sugar transport system permease protein
MLPGFVTLIPSYQLFYWLGWVNTFNPLVIPAFFGGGAFNIFLMRQFILTIPIDLDEAAEIDGAGPWAIFWHVLVPLCRPAIATMAILAFVSKWNDFMGPLIYLTGEDNYTSVLALMVFASQSVLRSSVPTLGGRVPTLNTGVDNLLMMATFITSLPGLILFFAFQRYFVQGIVLTGLKG